MRLETLGALAAFAAAALTVEQRGAASTFGLVLSYALTITQLTSITARPPAPPPAAQARDNFEPCMCSAEPHTTAQPRSSVVTDEPHPCRPPRRRSSTCIQYEPSQGRVKP